MHYLSIAILKSLSNAMGTAQLENITSVAMTLPEKERAKLAHDLVASLDGPADISIAEAWDIESGKTELIDADEAISHARARIKD